MWLRSCVYLVIVLSQKSPICALFLFLAEPEMELEPTGMEAQSPNHQHQGSPVPFSICVLYIAQQNLEFILKSTHLFKY